MKSFRLSILAFLPLWLAFLLPCSLVAQEPVGYQVKDVPNVQLNDSTAFVSDPDQILSESDRIQLNASIAELRDSFQVQVAVVVLPRIDEEAYTSEREFANLLFSEWGIGNKGKDDGLLILLTTDRLGRPKRKITFEVGYGLEGQLPDAYCKRIQTETMIPLMKDGDYGAGLIAGMEKIKDYLNGIESDPSGTPLKKDKLGQGNLPIVLWVGVGFFIYLILFFMAGGFNKEYASTKQLGKIAETNPWSIGSILFGLIFLPFYLIYALAISSINKKKKQKIRCDECGSYGQFEQVGEPQVIKPAYSTESGEKCYTFRCKQCGKQYKSICSYMNWGSIALMLIFAFLSNRGNNRSGGSGGSGGGGGSWGGGSSGGGGASSGF